VHVRGSCDWYEVTGRLVTRESVSNAAGEVDLTRRHHWNRSTRGAGRTHSLSLFLSLSLSLSLSFLSLLFARSPFVQAARVLLSWFPSSTQQRTLMRLIYCIDIVCAGTRYRVISTSQ